MAPGWAASRFPHSGAAPPGRAEGPSMALRRWLGVLPRSPAPRRLRSACAQVAIGGVCEVCVEQQEQSKNRARTEQEQSKSKSNAPSFPQSCRRRRTRRWRRPSGGVVQGETRQEPSQRCGREALCNACPRSNAGGREPRRGQARSHGFGYFGRNQSNPAVRAGTKRSAHARTDMPKVSSHTTPKNNVARTTAVAGKRAPTEGRGRKGRNQTFSARENGYAQGQQPHHRITSLALPLSRASALLQKAEAVRAGTERSAHAITDMPTASSRTTAKPRQRRRGQGGSPPRALLRQ
jgi:hypothetical protein